MTLPFAAFCHKCNVLMRPGTEVEKVDGNYSHELCANLPYRRFAPHKQPESDLRIG